ncbi:metal tolerance protein 11-like isoform X2 [Pomacea canaliculata]|uniref:metal tolerance protein 11-like isoform X2 n=1 Tax=Pomacea canaliculata TaxID=400727 RepID=UPI000D735376|nr:metal tolerance protein 11-like isoform X2 [Pomacea canaliculata]
MAKEGANGVYDNLALDIQEETAVFVKDSKNAFSMTLIVPGPLEKRENFLIGRAAEREEFLRMTRLTEVVPEHSNIVGGDDAEWKVRLEEFTSKRMGLGIKQCKSKRIRTYYKAQDELITAYEDMSVKVTTEVTETNALKRQQRMASLFSKITFGVNFMLMAAKLVASLLSGSMSMVSSLVDSVVDLLSGIIMWWASRAVRKRDPYSYPQGRTKLEPVSIIILSVIMAVASVQLIRESVELLVGLTSDSSDLPRMEIPTFVIAGSTIGIKLTLYIVCRRINSPIVQALAVDHRNDVVSNSVAIVCGYLGSQEFQDKTGLHGFIYADPVGAILIGLYIIFNWWKTGSEQIKVLTGHTARPDFLSKLTWVAMNHDKNIRHIDTVRAFHFGSNFLVELDIVLPEGMSLRMAHDIGESLQQKLENIPEVERAFVHLDYEYTHNPNTEHKVV